MTRNDIFKFILAIPVILLGWYLLIGFPGSDGKLQGGYYIKGIVALDEVTK